MAESGINSYFPSQTVSDAEKLSYDYGLKVAKAIETEWFNNDRSSNRYGTSCQLQKKKLGEFLTLVKI